MLVAERSIDTSSFPNFEGNIPFSIVKKDENSSVCIQKPETYVIDTQSDWNTTIGKISSDCYGNIKHFPSRHIFLSPLHLNAFKSRVSRV
jgi:hypothetical protein